MNTINDLRNVLFDTLNALKNKELERPRSCGATRVVNTV